MALFLMIMRKMVKNKWLVISLLGGLILSVALISSIPIYTEAILQRMLVKDLENLQKSTGQYPGIHYSKAVMGATSFWDTGDYKPEDRPQVIKGIDDFMRNEASPGFNLPVDMLVQERKTAMYAIAPADKTRIESKTNRQAEFAARSDLFDHIRLRDGRLPANQPVNGIYEALVVEQALKQFNMVLGNVFIIEDEEAQTKITIKPVGVIDKKDDADPYWYSNLGEYYQTFFIDFELYENHFTTGKVLPSTSASWLFLLNYSEIDLTSVHRFVETSGRIDTFLFNQFNTYNVDAPAITTLQTYFEREASLRKMLWALYVPIMIMLAFYLYMVSNLITEQQKAEIAVLRSRGASRIQVLSGYMIEGVLLGMIAFAVGPTIGMLLTKILGASNGFLEFVDRSSLPVKVSKESYRYALYAVASSVLMTLIPVFLATRMSIVSHKQQRARRRSQSFWHRLFLDIVLIAIALFGLRMFDRQRVEWMKQGADASDYSVDPLLFLIPALFILGTGLLIMRLYPWLIRLIYWVGRKKWSPVLYSTLIQVGRSGTQYLFVMMFLIMTIATGLYSASAARTLNHNTEEKILYKNGADIVLKQQWISDAPLPDRVGSLGGPPGTPTSGGSEGEGGSSVREIKRIQYLEPPFQPFKDLPGSQHAAKVFVKEDAGFKAGKESGTIRLMGINTAEFGRTTWLRNGLLDHHLNEYLNLIALDPKAVLISRSIADKGINPGDVIHIDWSGVDSKPFTVYGIIDYWPTFNPNQEGDTSDSKLSQMPQLVVGHLEYIQLALALEPYEVWIKLKAGENRQPFYDAIAANGMNLISIADTREELIHAKNDPFQLAINGVMTLGFLIAAIISFCGFLLYWVLSLSERVMQFGIFRAMGISFAQLMGMLTVEQLLTSGAAVLIGGLVGSLTSTLFVRLFQLSFNPATQVPPFQVTFDPSDSFKLYVIVTIMIIFGLCILGWLLSRIKIHQAVKLGED
ncbi:MAG: hypothetical protein K0R67_2988 [Paenibacillus sp.]|nr:hypothetical protein [Paenibacillus sp.]